MVDEAGEIDDGSSKSDHAEQARKRPYREEGEEADCKIQPSAYNDCNHNTHVKEHNGEEDVEDEDPRPTKRRKRHSQFTRYFTKFFAVLRYTRVGACCGVSRVTLPRLSQMHNNQKRDNVQSRVQIAVYVLACQ